MTVHCPLVSHGACQNTILCARCGDEYHETAEEWPDIRARSRGPGMGLDWLCPRCFAAFPPSQIEVYHVRHSCGHGAFWENGLAGLSVREQTCPWCPGPKKTALPHRAYADYGPPYGRVYPSMRRLGPGDGGGQLPVVVHHYPDESCCQSAEVSAWSG